MATSPTALAHDGETPLGLGARSADAVAALVDRLLRILLRPVPVATLTGEVLPELLAALDARAGAVLLYRPNDTALALAAARGLTADGAAHLERSRDDADAWTMPIRSLFDRRVYLLDDPESDPLVPAIVTPAPDATAPNVAAIPLYRWHLPLAVLLAVAGSRRIDETDVLSLAPAFDLVALALSAELVPAREHVVGDPAARTPPAPLTCAPWIDPRRALEPPPPRHLTLAEPAPPRRDAEHETIQSLVRELHTAVAALEAERRAVAEERTLLGDRVAAADRDRMELLARVRSLEERMHERPAASGAPSPEAGPAVLPPAPAPQDAPPPPGAAVELPPVAEPAPAPPARPATPASGAAVPAALGPCRILEPDTDTAARITAALEAALSPTARAGLVIANLRGAPADVLEALADTTAPLPPIAYAADPASARSRVLGAVRCLAEPPDTAVAAALLSGAVRGTRRIITISSDVDTFMPAKLGLTKAGHSVSMACDYKQALDLLAILRPDAVLVDLRTEAESAAAFLDALLAPEHPRVLLVLIHGDPTGATLSNVVERMLRPLPLDPSDLARKARSWTGDSAPPPRPGLPSR